MFQISHFLCSLQVFRKAKWHLYINFITCNLDIFVYKFKDNFYQFCISYIDNCITSWSRGSFTSSFLICIPSRAVLKRSGERGFVSWLSCTLIKCLKWSTEEKERWNLAHGFSLWHLTLLFCVCGSTVIGGIAEMVHFTVARKRDTDWGGRIMKGGGKAETATEGSQYPCHAHSYLTCQLCFTS